MNDFDAIRDRAILECKAGRYAEARHNLEGLLALLKRNGAPTTSSQTTYWYLVAKYDGDERRAMDEFIMLDD